MDRFFFIIKYFPLPILAEGNKLQPSVCGQEQLLASVFPCCLKQEKEDED